MSAKIKVHVFSHRNSFPGAIRRRRRRDSELTKFARHILPSTPPPRSLEADIFVFGCKTLIVGRDHIVAFVFWDVRVVWFPGVGEEVGRAVLVEEE